MIDPHYIKAGLKFLAADTEAEVVSIDIHTEQTNFGTLRMERVQWRFTGGCTIFNEWLTDFAESNKTMIQ